MFFEDVIGRSPATSSFADTGEFFSVHSFDIPYGILLPKGVENLLVGSAKSVSCVPQGLLRAMATCMELGQAAGCAAGLASDLRVKPRELEIRSLQRALVQQGVYLGTPDRLAALGVE